VPIFSWDKTKLRRIKLTSEEDVFVTAVKEAHGQQWRELNIDGVVDPREEVKHNEMVGEQPGNRPAISKS